MRTTSTRITLEEKNKREERKRVREIVRSPSKNICSRSIFFFFLLLRVGIFSLLRQSGLFIFFLLHSFSSIELSFRKQKRNSKHLIKKNIHLILFKILSEKLDCHSFWI